MHSITYNYAPQTFANTWIKINDRNTGHNYEMTRTIYCLTRELNLKKKIPIYSLASAWNDAGVLRFYQNKTTFKIALKDHLLNEIDEN